MHWRRQGDLGQLSAMEWFASKGAGIYFPVGHSPHCDFIAEFGDRLARVQVKSCTAYRFDRWQVTICTRGGNQSGADSSSTSTRRPVTTSSLSWAMAAAGAFLRTRSREAVALRLEAPSTPSSRSSPAARCRPRTATNPPLQSASRTLGGMSEWLKEHGCKPCGSAYAGSNPAPPTTGHRAGKYADVAQLVEHLHGKEGVRGSSPLVGSQEGPRTSGAIMVSMPHAYVGDGGDGLFSAHVECDEDGPFSHVNG